MARFPTSHTGNGSLPLRSAIAQQPAAFAWRFTDVDQVNEAVKGASLETVQLTPGAVDGMQVKIDLGPSSLGFGVLNRAVRARGSPPPAAFTFVFKMTDAGSAVFKGFDASTHDLLAARPENQYDGHVTEYVDWAAIAVPCDEVARTVRLLEGVEIEDLFRRGMLFRPAQAENAALRQRLHDLRHTARTNPTLFLDPNLCIAMHRSLMHRLAKALCSGDHASGAGSPIEKHRRHEIVKHAEDYMIAHAREPLYIGELCADVGVSERSLEYAFRELLNVTPTAYLRLHRFKQARHELKVSESHATTIATIANRWGFWHLGRFAQEYRAFFGESPSQTLRRRA